MYVTVRRVEPTDGPLLRSVRLAALQDAPSAFASTYESEVLLSDAEWTQRATRAASGPGWATFLAHAGDRSVGLVGAFRSDDDPGGVELVSMWTAPDARNRGVARALVEAVLDWARVTDATAVQLWVTRGNDAAQSLYGRLGFRETGEHQPLPSDPCKDELRMVLRL